MAQLEKELVDIFGGRLRTRVNGILIQNDEILLIKHQMGESRDFWNVPGGGMKYGSSIEANLKREFLEETGLQIEVLGFVAVREYLEIPLHAVELFYEVRVIGGKLKLGIDPELDPKKQLITEIGYFDIKKLISIKNENKHPLFWGINSLNDVRIWK